MKTALALLFAATFAAAQPVSQEPYSKLRANGPMSLAITYRCEPKHRTNLRQHMLAAGVKNFERWKAQGILQDYKILFNSYLDSDTFDMMALLTFAKYSDVDRWREVEKTMPGGLSGQALEFVTSAVTTPVDALRHSASPKPAERGRFDQLFRSLRVGARPSARIEPLEDTDIEAIRRTIGPIRGAGSHLSFPEVFSSHARLRNWLMFEVALELGIRRGELLKLRLDSLPRASDDGIRILRRPDDPHDSRAREPAVKTAERVIPASRVAQNRAGVPHLPSALGTRPRQEPLSVRDPLRKSRLH